jgi:hypothetical protein
MRQAQEECVISHKTTVREPNPHTRSWRSPFYKLSYGSTRGVAGLATSGPGRLVDGGHVLFTVPGVYRLVEVLGSGFG